MSLNYEVTICPDLLNAPSRELSGLSGARFNQGSGVRVSGLRQYRQERQKETSRRSWLKRCRLRLTLCQSCSSSRDPESPFPNKTDLTFFAHLADSRCDYAEMTEKRGGRKCPLNLWWHVSRNVPCLSQRLCICYLTTERLLNNSANLIQSEEVFRWWFSAATHKELCSEWRCHEYLSRPWQIDSRHKWHS